MLTRQGSAEPSARAALLIAALQGAMPVARVGGDTQRFDVIADRVSRQLADA